MKTIVFLGTTSFDSGREAVRLAGKLGYSTVIFTKSPTLAKNPERIPEVHKIFYNRSMRFYPLRRQIRTLQLEGFEIAAIISFVDFYTYTACLLAEEFHVNRFSIPAYKHMSSKIMTRNLLSDTPYSPHFTILTNSDPQILEPLAKQLPLVVKMPRSVASKDVFKVTSKAQLDAFISEISPDPEHPVIVEEYLDGPQYLVEVIVFAGRIHIVAFIRQEVDFNDQGRFIITGYSMILDRNSERFRSAERAVQSIVERHGLTNGSCHMELRHVNGEWKLIEINSRMSGSGMNQLINYAYGINLMEETIKLWLGEAPKLTAKHQKHTYNRFVTASTSGLCKSIIGVSKARECPGVREVFIRPVKGRRLRPPLSLADRYAYVIANGDTEEEAERNAKSAASLICFNMWR